MNVFYEKMDHSGQYPLWDLARKLQEEWDSGRFPRSGAPRRPLREMALFFDIEPWNKT